MNEQTETPAEMWVSAASHAKIVEYAASLKRRNKTHVARIAGLNSALTRQRTEIARLKAEATLAKRKRSWWSRLFWGER